MNGAPQIAGVPLHFVFRGELVNNVIFVFFPTGDIHGSNTYFPILSSPLAFNETPIFLGSASVTLTGILSPPPHKTKIRSCKQKYQEKKHMNLRILLRPSIL